MKEKIKVPDGLSKCEVCGEYNGTAKWKELSEYPHTVKDDDYFSVSCLCQGILCHKCKQNKIHRPISNSYYEDENCIWHNPWFTGMRWCDECSNKDKIKQLIIKLDKECPWVPHTGVGRLFSMVRRMKAEKEINLPINYRSGGGISAKTGKSANEITEQEWERLYQYLRNRLKRDYPDLYYSLFSEENNS